MKLTSSSLMIPAPISGQELYLTYDLTSIFAAEARYEEIGTVTAASAPDLLRSFSIAMKDLTAHFADLSYRESVAKRKCRERRAVVVTEVIPLKLAEKKLSANETNREALIDLDPEYNAATDVLNQIEASFIYVREKLRALESAINSTKKVLDNVSYISNLPNHNLQTSVGTEPTGPFGKAKYG